MILAANVLLHSMLSSQLHLSGYYSNICLVECGVQSSCYCCNIMCRLMLVGGEIEIEYPQNKPDKHDGLRLLTFYTNTHTHTHIYIYITYKC
jgi:hypothetical protein